MRRVWKGIVDMRKIETYGYDSVEFGGPGAEPTSEIRLIYKDTDIFITFRHHITAMVPGYGVREGTLVWIRFNKYKNNSMIVADGKSITLLHPDDKYDRVIGCRVAIKKIISHMDQEGDLPPWVDAKELLHVIRSMIPLEQG